MRGEFFFIFIVTLWHYDYHYGCSIIMLWLLGKFRYRIHSMVYDDKERSKNYGDSPLFGCDFGVLAGGTINMNDVLCIKP